MKSKQIIWVLFSIDNDYNQPHNNLVAWWSVKPSIAQLKVALHDYEDTTAQALYKGKEVRYGEADYRLAAVPENTVLEGKQW